MSIADQVIEFYNSLFGRIFSEPFRSEITDPYKRNDVFRQVEASADAASQSLTRFFTNEQLTEPMTANILSGFIELPELLRLEDIANTNITPEAVVKDLLVKMPCPRSIKRANQDAVYRVALHSVIQGLMLVGPVMAEWRRLNFSRTFELPNRIVDKLNAITEQLAATGHTGQAAEDERFELTYRDYLLQRFYRVEAGTVRMTTQMAVDLRELFVMPRVLARPKLKEEIGLATIDPASLMNLQAAREFFGELVGSAKAGKSAKQKKSRGITALNQVKRSSRNVIIGLPGSGKSTFLEWLQLKLASAEEIFVLGGAQAIPLLLRVRELNPKRLPKGKALIEKATGSKDRAALMPEGWIERQMEAGRVLLMLDGLDETEPELCDRYVLPWLAEICEQYKDCGYLISSRPVGYPPGALHELEFKECDLLNFGEPEVAEYVRHWCTAIRLAQNEPKQEAVREGTAEGEKIVEDFKRHPYIRDLAHNPLMLSAICLVNYFERGELPKDRAVLYKLCVEGLLHNWDQRRGIYSEFTLEEKLRTCREVALAMQADDRAEYEGHRVQRIFSVVLGDPDRAEKLMEHIRYRTGLLIERRAGIFAFAHLTFQEYLAAQAVHEGNLVGVDAERLAKEHDDGRWKEVIALYCGSASATAAREMIKHLIVQQNSFDLSNVLADAYLSAGPKLSQDRKFRKRVLVRMAVAPSILINELERFPDEEVAPIANNLVGKMGDESFSSEAYGWLRDNPKFINEKSLFNRLQDWKAMSPSQVYELVYLLHLFGTSDVLSKISTDIGLYESPGPPGLRTQAEIALFGLLERSSEFLNSPLGLALVLQTLQVISNSDTPPSYLLLRESIIQIQPKDTAMRLELSSLALKLLGSSVKSDKQDNSIVLLRSWAESLERGSSTQSKRASRAKRKSKTTAKAVSKKSAKKKPAKRR